MPDDPKAVTTEINIDADNEVVQELLANQYGRHAADEVRAALESRYATVWNEEEFQRAFSVRNTLPPYVYVSNRETGQLGTVIYVDSPRFYFLFNPEVVPNE